VEARKHKHYNRHEKAVTPDPTPREKLKKGLNELVFEQPIIVKLLEITLEPIRLELYYDYNKWDIRPDAAKVLDSLVTHMKENPEIVIELSSHTDSRGKDAYNLKLSQNRAKSAVDYVINHGIDPKMILAKGEGETRPLITPEKDDRDYQLNRRTEVRVVRILDLEE
jgi:outer membrane protein OmpA-like peptidoglycan-associated protein